MEGVLRLHDISLHILELIENSLRANSTVIAIRLEFDVEADVIQVCVDDNGEGLRVPPEQVLNPFYTTSTRKKVGLGLSLFKEAAEMAGGSLTLSRSEELGGVAVKAWMGLSHVDRPPLGDLAATISTMILANPAIEFRLSMRGEARSYSFRLADFVKLWSLDPGANVELASSVFVALRAELEIWKRYELLSSKQNWRAMNALSLRAGYRKLEQGVDA
jgi:hypothetical protein